MLRALQNGITIADLECLEYGMVMDIVTEAGNDFEKYNQLATQADYDNF